LTNKKTCAIRSETLHKRFISPCGLCIKVCPVGDDRKVLHRQDPGFIMKKMRCSTNITVPGSTSNPMVRDNQKSILYLSCGIFEYNSVMYHKKDL
jgi:ferredoxin